MTLLICPSDFGEYDGKIYLKFPSHMLSVNGGYYTDKEGCLIDLCLVNEIRELWDKGVSTYASCCGHGRIHGTIAVDEKDRQKMVELGYKTVAENDCTFISKSKHKEKYKLK